MSNYYNCIYLYTNKVNNKKYVGQTIDFNKRHSSHISTSFNPNSVSYNLPFHNAIRKYGIDNFDIKILAHDIPTQDLMNEYEVFFIKRYNTMANTGHGYNISSGGASGNKFAGKTEEEMIEIRERMVKNRKTILKGENHPHFGKTITEEHKTKLREANLGKVVSEETKRKISESHKGKPKSKEHIEKIKLTKEKNGSNTKGKNNPMYGKKHTEETKKKMSERQQGNNSPRARKIVCLNNNYLFTYAKGADQWAIKCDSAKCARGKSKTSGKHPETGESLKWMFLEDWLKLEGNNMEDLIPQ